MDTENETKKLYKKKKKIQGSFNASCLKYYKQTRRNHQTRTIQDDDVDIFKKENIDERWFWQI